ncbi:MAG: hypothetical protein KDA89_23520 [Planctomycetaceae bacterium]|nr:hypothetical protein [Planctomycetaceae bacterium]
MSDRQQLRVLTLSGTIPGEPGVGGVILKDLMMALPPGMLQCFPAVSQHVIQLGWLDHAAELAGYVVRRYETGWRPVSGVIGEAVGRVARLAAFSRHCRQLVREVCASPAAQDCDIVWAILDCPTVIEIAAEVARRLNKPFVVLVWDAPELLVNQLCMDRWSGAVMLKRFAELIRGAERVGVICEQMQAAYENHFGPGEYVILRHGIREELWKEVNEEPRCMKIGFAGSITAAEPFRALIAALDELEWTVNGRSVTLRLIGSRYTLDSRQAQHIEFFGWRSLEDTIRLLSECSLAYLPQPFEYHLRPLAELSFPTKLSTYLAASCPVLLHAPEYASLVPFLSAYPVGQCCHSLETGDVSRALRQTDQLQTADVAAAIHAARQNEFSSSVFVNRFGQLIGWPVRCRSESKSAELARHA